MTARRPAGYRGLRPAPKTRGSYAIDGVFALVVGGEVNCSERVSLLPPLFIIQLTSTHVQGPLISNAYAEETSTVSGPSKLLLSAMLLVSVLFRVAK